jgi:hypothetical protein
MNDRDPTHLLPEPSTDDWQERERLEADAADLMNASVPSLFDICASAMAAQAGVKEPKMTDQNHLSYLGTVRKFALDRVTDARNAPPSERSAAEREYNEADRAYRQAFFGRKA